MGSLNIANVPVSSTLENVVKVSDAGGTRTAKVITQWMLREAPT